MHNYAITPQLKKGVGMHNYGMAYTQMIASAKIRRSDNKVKQQPQQQT